MSTYTEDHLIEQPAIQLMQHELGWDVVSCYDEWSGGVSNQGRDGKREVVLVSRLRSALRRLNPDLPVEAIEGAVEERGILNVGFLILNGRGRLPQAPRLKLAEAPVVHGKVGVHGVREHLNIVNKMLAERL